MRKTNGAYRSVSLLVIFLFASTLAYSESQDRVTSSTSGAASGTVVHSISDGVYSNISGDFTLSLPEGWKINNALADAPYSLGGLQAPDSASNVLIQRMPTSMSAAAFIKEMDAQGPKLWKNYRRISVGAAQIGGLVGASLTMTYLQANAAAAGPAVSCEALMIVAPAKDSLIVFTFITLEDLFGVEENS